MTAAIVAADVPITSIGMLKANDARDVAVTSAWQFTLFLLDEFTNNKKKLYK